MYFKIFSVLHVCLFFNYVQCEKYSNFFVTNEDGDKISENCIMKIIRNNVDCGSTITVVTEVNVDTLLEAISNEECYSVIIRNFSSKQWFVRNEYIIVLTKNIFEFESAIIAFSNDLMWNANAKYIIQIANIGTGQEIAQVLVKHNIFIAIFMDDGKSDSRMYTYYPFETGNYAGDQDTVVSLGLCNDNLNLSNIFPYNFPDKFDKCIIRVATRKLIIPHVILESSNYTCRGIRLPGLEEYIIDTIGANKGYFIDYISTGNNTLHGTILPNGTATGVLKYLDTDKADIAIGGFILVLDRAMKFDHIWGHHFGLVNMFTAREPVNRWKLVYKAFNLLTWIIIGGFYCLFVAVFNIYNIIDNFMKDRVLLSLKLWGYFFGNASSTLYKKKKIRGILVCWIWFTFFVSNFYNTAFYSLTTGQHSHIHNIKKFDSSIYKTCICDSMRTLLISALNKSWSENAFTTCDDRNTALAVVASRNDLFSVEVEHIYATNEYKFIDDEGSHMLDVWEFTNGALVTTMYTTRGFPLKDMIQTFTRNMAETGLVQAHLHDIQLTILKAVYAKQKPFKNLDLKSIGVAFGLLFSGLLIALIAFILEIVHKKSQLLKKTKTKTCKMTKINEIKIK